VGLTFLLHTSSLSELCFVDSGLIDLLAQQHEAM
jgi:hypothetical protein